MHDVSDQPPARDGATSEIPALTGLRGLACIGVLISHALLAKKIVIGGGPWVDLFFVLSGFVISYAYLGKLQTGETRWGRFARARFARLYPLYIATALVFAIAGLAAYLALGDRPAWLTIPQTLREITMTSALPLIGANIVWNSPAWSVVIEWWVNFTLFPILVLVGDRVPVKILAVATLALMIAFGIAMAAADASHLLMQRGWIALARGFVGFAAGWAVFRLWRETDWTIDRRAGVPLSIAALAITYAPAFSGDNLEWIALALYPAVILFVLRSPSVTRAALETGIAVYLGRISYSVYLIHPMIIKVLPWLLPATSGLGIAAFAIVAIVATIGVSHFAYAWLERPARRYLMGRPARLTTVEAARAD